MQRIKEIVFFISKKVIELIPLSFEKVYYEKMEYSEKNTILDSDVKTLRETIAFEVAFIHVISFLVSRKIPKLDYLELLKFVDKDEIYSWYEIDDNEVKTELDKIDLSFDDISALINKHDTFVDKDIKKKLGQFYTPVSIAQKMVLEIKDELKSLTDIDALVDPACGTGVFIVETIKLMSTFMSLPQLCMTVQNNMFAYDVNPFSVIATKFNVLNALLDIATSNRYNDVCKYINFEFENIKWKNTISESDDHCYSIIIGNPPYFKLDSNSLKNITGYDEIIYGQPNIYSLFMYWGIKHLRENGTMSFIVPQSIRSGLYFKKLREELQKYRIKSILHIDSRQNVFDRAEQAVLIICLKKAIIRNSKTRIQFIDGSQNVLTDFSIERKKLMLGADNNYMFVIGKHTGIYSVFEKVYANSYTLSDDGTLLKFSNGLFVWNQHKDTLVGTEDLSVPIVYGGCVQPLKFEFKTSWNNQERKPYARITKKIAPFLLSGKRLLVQRTTNFEKDIRLKACLISDGFLEKNKHYLLENHVNFLGCASHKNDLVSEKEMLLYLGLLNSKLVNFIFTSKSGNTQVSANELNLLPFPKNKADEISAFVSKHLLDLTLHQTELDNIVCEAYGLTAEETNIVISI